MNKFKSFFLFLLVVISLDGYSQNPEHLTIIKPNVIDDVLYNPASVSQLSRGSMVIPVVQLLIVVIFTMITLLRLFGIPEATFGILIIHTRPLLI
jgi:hypothetical protein